jgi:hypothetical protein
MEGVSMLRVVEVLHITTLQSPQPVQEFDPLHLPAQPLRKR